MQFIILFNNKKSLNFCFISISTASVLWEYKDERLHDWRLATTVSLMLLKVGDKNKRLKEIIQLLNMKLLKGTVY